MGLGKQQPVDTQVATPSGWRRIGDLTVGDLVIGSNGQPTRVCGVFPQGVKPSYRLRFSDDSSVEAGPEHLWTVSYLAGGRRWQELTVTTAQLQGTEPIDVKWPTGRTTRLVVDKLRFYLPMLSAPIAYAAGADLPIHPYLLGQLIGNGSLNHGTPKLVTGTRDWPDVVARFAREGVAHSVPRTYGSAVHVTFSGITDVIRALNLDVLSAEKRVPASYMTASIDARIALLHGLMDTDGSITAQRNRIVYHTTSRGLATDVRMLVEGLGGIASVREYDRTDEDKPIEFQVRVRLPESIRPFSVTHKAARYTPGSHASPVRVLQSVEYVRDVESVCIAVDAPDRLYVTEHCILTHNTMQAIMSLPTNGKVMVVCPAAIKHNWKAEFARWRPEYRVSVLEGKKAFRAPEAGEVVIINYDVLPAYLVAAKGEDGAYAHETPAAMVEALSDVRLILDEAHAVKNYKAARSKKVGTLVRLVKTAWLLTGTPLLTRPSDLWGMLSAGGLAGEVFGNFARYMKLFGASKGRYGIEWGSPSAEVPERLRRVMLRRLRAEVLPDLPAKTYKDISVPVTGKLAELLDAAYEAWCDSEAAYEDEDYARRGRRAPSSLPSFHEFSRIRAELASAKIEAMLEMVAEHEEQEVPLLVFSAHRAPIDALASREGWAVITGDTSSADRARIVAEFQAGQLKGVGLTIQAGGVGLTLTHASNVLFVDLDWTPALNAQAEDRVVRIGQTATSVLITRLVCEHPMDKHVAALIAAKMRLIEGAVEHEIAYVPKADRRSTTVDAAVLAAMTEAQAKADREEAQAKVANIAAREGAKAPYTQTAPLTEAVRAAIRAAITQLAESCDGAVEKDGAGFNKADANIGHWLALTGLEDETSLRVAWAIAARYPRQVGHLFTTEGGSK
jgi:hypothetical protein